VIAVGREVAISIIREVVRGWPIDDVKVYADSLPTKVNAGAQRFCDENELGRRDFLWIAARNIVVADELYRFLDEECKPSVVQTKEAVASGDKTNANT
jgi:hypothetical protein